MSIAKRIIVGATLLFFGGCTHSYVPGPGKSVAEFGPDSGRCRLLAHATRPDTSFASIGSPKFVAISSGAAALAGAIGTAIHDSQIYDDCMQANNWLVADTQRAPASAQPVVAAPLSPSQDEAAPVQPQSAMQTAMPLQEPSQVSARVAQVQAAQRAAEAWVIAQNVLNGRGSAAERRDLYVSLCSAGDATACGMAQSLTPLALAKR